MGKIKATILVGILFVFSNLGWAQDLEIHYINVQQGQSTLIIGPNGTTILYDGGDKDKGTFEVIPYLQGLGINTSQPLDYIIASHRDEDHYKGLTEVMTNGYDALNVFDNGSDKYNTSIQKFLDAAAATTAGGVVPMPMGYVIDLGNGAAATCVAVDGSVLGVGAIPGGQNNENDRSVCLLIQYGDFDYLVTGDTGGGDDDNSCTGRSTDQVNIETPLVQAIMPGGANPLLKAYGVELAHVGHHGSESSGNSDYMNLLTPDVACISVGDGQRLNYYHPRKDVVENVFLAQAPCITAPPALVLQTEEGYPTGEKTSFAGYCVGDIVITTNGVNYYSISATGDVSQGPDERNAAGLPAAFSFDEVISRKGDFDRDGYADVIWRYQGPEGYNVVWLSSNASLMPIPATLDPMDDVIKSYVSDPRNDPQSVELLPVANQNWKLAGTGDFNGDGKIDIVWSNVDTAHNCLWYMDGINFDGYAKLPDGSTTDWVLGGVGDFNRDGHPDLIWHNEVDGRNGIWYLDDVQLIGIDIMTTGANVNWKLCGTGDFNCDGHVDIVWRNIVDGRNAVWYMEGVELSSVGWLDPVPNLDWKLRGTGDFNNDGNMDLIWTDISDGSNCIWYLNNITVTGFAYLTTVTDTNWMIRNQ